MIPDVGDTIAQIERDLPGYGWLLRTIEDQERDSRRGKGTHFAHVYKMENNVHTLSYRTDGGSAASALYAAYCAAKTAL